MSQLHIGMEVSMPEICLLQVSGQPAMSSPVESTAHLPAFLPGPAADEYIAVLSGLAWQCCDDSHLSGLLLLSHYFAHCPRPISTSAVAGLHCSACVPAMLPVLVIHAALHYRIIWGNYIGVTVTLWLHRRIPVHKLVDSPGS